MQEKKQTKSSWEDIGVQHYDFKLPIMYAKRLNTLLEAKIYPNNDAIFSTMVRWWLNQPSVKNEIKEAEKVINGKKKKEKEINE